MKKKTLALLLATALCVSMFAGCGKAQNEAASDTASSEVSTEAADAAVPATAKS